MHKFLRRFGAVVLAFSGFVTEIKAGVFEDTFGSWPDFDYGKSNAVMIAGTQYYVMQFTTTGTHSWTPPAGVASVDVLIVGGGASGGGSTSTRYGCGGGGAGAMGYYEFIPVSGECTITVGAGGASVSNSYGTNGGDSSFTCAGFSATCKGGGGGGLHSSDKSKYARSGGSGGGEVDNTSAGAAADVAEGQWGNAGGHGAKGNMGASNSQYGGGGGGGAGSAGVDATGNTTTGSGGDGGAGRISDITGTDFCYAAGGGGGVGVSACVAGVGGSGIGGNGGAGAASGTAGEDKTGSGGGGSGGGGSGNTSGAGGSGIVIVRYNYKAANSWVVEPHFDKWHWAVEETPGVLSYQTQYGVGTEILIYDDDEDIQSMPLTVGEHTVTIKIPAGNDYSRFEGTVKYLVSQNPVGPGLPDEYDVNYTWTGGGLSNAWDDPDNWSPSINPDICCGFPSNLTCATAVFLSGAVAVEVGTECPVKAMTLESGSDVTLSGAGKVVVVISDGLPLGAGKKLTIVGNCFENRTGNTYYRVKLDGGTIVFKNQTEKMVKELYQNSSTSHVVLDNCAFTTSTQWLHWHASTYDIVITNGCNLSFGTTSTGASGILKMYDSTCKFTPDSSKFGGTFLLHNSKLSLGSNAFTQPTDFTFYGDSMVSSKANVTLSDSKTISVDLDSLPSVDHVLFESDVGFTLPEGGVSALPTSFTGTGAENARLVLSQDGLKISVAVKGPESGLIIIVR